MTGTRLLDRVRHAVRVRQSGFSEIAHLPMSVVCTATRHYSASTPRGGLLGWCAVAFLDTLGAITLALVLVQPDVPDTQACKRI